MILLWFVFVWWFTLSLMDIWKMAKSEFPYWDLINKLIINTTDNIERDRIVQKKDAASTAASHSMFGVWYVLAFLILTGMVIEGWIPWYKELGTLLACAFVHYAGGEDLLYFILATWITISEDWYKARETVKRFWVRFPKYLPWLAVPRKIGSITIKPWWITHVAGEQVHIDGLITSVVFVLTIIIIVAQL